MEYIQQLDPLSRVIGLSLFFIMAGFLAWYYNGPTARLGLLADITGAFSVGWFFIIVFGLSQFWDDKKDIAFAIAAVFSLSHKHLIKYILLASKNHIPTFLDAIIRRVAKVLNARLENVDKTEPKKGG